MLFAFAAACSAAAVALDAHLPATAADVSDQVVVPVRTIKGATTGLLWPSGVAVDASGAVYVSNDGDLAAKQDSVTVYSPGATGDAAPARVISGGRTGLTRPGGLAVDAAGILYVANAGVSGAGSSILGQDRVLVFAAGAKGDVAPLRYITNDIVTPKAVAFDVRGFVYVSNYGAMVNAPNSITVYKPGASADATPVRAITGSRTTLDTPLGLAIGPHGDVFVVNSGRVNMGIDSIIIFAPGANGNATPERTITGDKTDLDVPQGVAVDAAGYIYVTNFGSSSITVYAPNANGNAAPVRLIAGTDANLGAYVAGVAAGVSDGDLYVVSRSQQPTTEPSWVGVFSRSAIVGP